MIPNAIADGAFSSFNLPYYSEAIRACKVFFVEHLKPARRLLTAIIRDLDWQTISLWQWKDAEVEVRDRLAAALKRGDNIGVISDAGCPGIADPGQEIVRISHQAHAQIIPMIGPSAIFLALMASGCQGQRFSFHGYLPIDKSACSKYIKAMLRESQAKQASQIFIETPHRNNSLLQLLLELAPPNTLLCIASNMGAPDATIHTNPIQKWRQNPPVLAKKPCTFILYLE